MKDILRVMRQNRGKEMLHTATKARLNITKGFNAPYLEIEIDTMDGTLSNPKPLEDAIITITIEDQDERVKWNTTREDLGRILTLGFSAFLSEQQMSREHDEQARVKEISDDILEWAGHDINEALEDKIISDAELHDECDLVYSINMDGMTYWIQRIFSRSKRVYEFFTLYGVVDFTGSFNECVAFLNKK
jgi:hypothetical protein